MTVKTSESRLPPAASPLMERMVTTTVTVESWMARALYWIGACITVLALAWAGLIINQTMKTGNWRDGLIYTLVLLAIGAVAYFLGWGWRWLWTGRTDNLFARKRYTAPGRLETARQKIVTVLSFWMW